MAFYARSSVNKKHVRKSNYDPLIEKVKLIEANLQYAHNRYLNGKETTVSGQHLSPKRDDYEELDSEQNDMHEENITKPSSTHPDV